MAFIYDLFDMRLLGQTAVAKIDEYSIKTKLGITSSTMHYHDMWEIFFVHEGILTEHFADHELKIESGYLILIPPGVPHSTISTKQSATISSHIRIEIEDSKKSNLNKFLSDFSLKPLAIPEAVPPKLDTIKDMYQRWRKSGRCNLLLAENIGAQLRILMCELISSLMPQTNQSTLIYKRPTFSDASIIDLIMLRNPYSKFNNELTLEIIAETLGYSVEHTSRIIKKRFGKSFRTLVYETKIEYAKYCLSDSDMSPNEIAKLLQYGTVNNFTKCFKAAVGETPVEYRRRCRISKLKQDKVT
ncbi:MAG: AraC family transcriptional regulator [Clostridia bacterium]|nr:AraC family transcriptional regulator [Clostridia bacterium]